MRPKLGDHRTSYQRAPHSTIAGIGLARWTGFLWLLVFILVGSGLGRLGRLRSEPPRRLREIIATDARIELFGHSEVQVALILREEATLDPSRMVLTVPVLDSDVIIPAGARIVLLDEKGRVTVLDRPLPAAVVRALARSASPALDTLAERLEASKVALDALDSLPRVKAFLTRK